MVWWERWPDRFEQEVECLSAHELEPEDISTPEEKANGYRSIEIKYPHEDDQRLPITLRFPPEYPFFMAVAFLDPEVMLLTRHQNPTNGELCLLNAGQSWKPEDFIGDVIAEMLPQILKIHSNPHGDYAKEQEVEQGEPITGYFSKDNKSLLLVENIVVPEHYSEGTFEAKILASGGSGSRYVLMAVTNNQDRQSISVSAKLRNSLQELPTKHGKWKRLHLGVENIPRHSQDFSELAKQIHNPTWQSFQHRPKPGNELLLALIREEVRQDRYQDSWLGVQLSAGTIRTRGKGKHRNKSPTKRGQIIFGAPYDSETRWARSPELAELENKHVCLVGAGMLGSPIALQLARAGVGKLSIVDHDYVELATIIRYGLGAQYAGWPKVAALHEHIQQNYFFTDVEAIPYRVGTPFLTETDVAGKFRAAVESADLVIDAAAEKNVSYYLNDLLSNSDHPWMVVTTRPGTWGGETWIMRPRGPCWACLEAHNRDKSLPMPNGDADRELQIGGCTQLTTTGYGCDSDLYALNAVRSAIGLMTPGVHGYPEPDWNALIMNLRGTSGGYISPEFTPYDMPHHPECDCYQTGV